MGEPCSVSAVRGVEPRQVLEAVEAYFDRRGVAHERRTAGPEPGDVEVFESHGGWTTVRWPAYFLPRDVEACLDLSRDLHTVVSTMGSTVSEGWSHAAMACGTLLDKFHSYPAALAWDGDDLPALAAEWSGDPGLVARLFGVPETRIRRHFCQACPDARDHPGKNQWGFVAFWADLGITHPGDRVASYAALRVDPSWQRLTAVG